MLADRARVERVEQLPRDQVVVGGDGEGAHVRAARQNWSRKSAGTISDHSWMPADRSTSWVIAELYRASERSWKVDWLPLNRTPW